MKCATNKAIQIINKAKESKCDIELRFINIDAHYSIEHQL